MNGGGSQVTFEEAGHILQLGNVVWTVPTVLLQQTEGVQVLAAGVAVVQLPQGGVDLPPVWDKTQSFPSEEDGRCDAMKDTRARLTAHCQ